jgi:hypothetical protein
MDLWKSLFIFRVEWGELVVQTEAINGLFQTLIEADHLAENLTNGRWYFWAATGTNCQFNLCIF